MAENTRAPFEWGAAFDETYNDLSQQFVQYFPQLLGTATLLLLGFIMAKTLALSAQKLVEGLDALFVRFAHTDHQKARVLGSDGVLFRGGREHSGLGSVQRLARPHRELFTGAGHRPADYSWRVPAQ